MPFSSVLGASSVIKPGVCTSSTRPTVPYTGQLIYETDTGMVAAWNGSEWVYTHSSGLVLISSTTIGSAVSSVTVNGAFSADYDNYRIIISGGTSSAFENLTLQLGATTTGYYAASITALYSTAAVVTASDNNTASFTRFGTCNTDGLNACGDIISPFLAKNTFMVSNKANNATNSSAAINNGYLNNTTSYTAFTIAPSSGTITGGTIKVYGYRN
jgi:hypothetical protein